MIQPGVVGEWSIKDLVAHITWHEREMVGVLKARALVGSDLWDLPQHKRNAIIFEENHHRPLREVFAESQDVHQELVEELLKLSDEDLNDPGRFADMPADWIPWDLIAGNTYIHYQDHLKDLHEWFERARQNS